MIVTRSWLSEFVDLEGISDESICDTLNSIGLEVASLKKIIIPEGIVVGKIISCEKHPDADKLNVCEVDIGYGVRQIVCGATNVVDAEYVAVATIGAKLQDGLEIKHTQLRGVDSDGMICSASELGLPKIGEGIMILDASIGELKIGEPLQNYKTINDSIIEVELTPNRGDCLSILGVARDLSAAYNREMKLIDVKLYEHTSRAGISRHATLESEEKFDIELIFALVNIDVLRLPLVIDLRLAFVQEEAKDSITAITLYATLSTGVIIRAYNEGCFAKEDEVAKIKISKNTQELIEVLASGNRCSIVGVNQFEGCAPIVNGEKVFIEASYVSPQNLAQADLSKKDIPTDRYYYNTSRGSNPDVNLGIRYTLKLLEKSSNTEIYDGFLTHEHKRENTIIKVSIAELSRIIGADLEKSNVISILKRLGFDVSISNEDFLAITVPLFRADIVNSQDIAEEILRMIGIDNIEPRALSFVESYHQRANLDEYLAKKSIRYKSVGAGFYETISYMFSERKLLEKYGFETVDANLELLNPIVEELNTLRTTLLINLLLAAKRNANYSKRTIPLFEIGAVFDNKRKQKEKIAFLFSGNSESENITNSGKPKIISAASFIEKLGSAIGIIELAPCSHQNGLIHPYQSADIVIEGKLCGYISKLHLNAQEDFGLKDTFIAELDVNALIKRKKVASAISNFQGVYKDLSVVLAKDIVYSDISAQIDALNLKHLRSFYPIDIYNDSSLKNDRSLTLRMFIQSSEKTLEDNDIEDVVSSILSKLEESFGAKLR
ncbi:MAG: phenylalanine--tRNA ligase subunit beta [Campylobacterales bacterium]|nr:phenylalanine--tRNA ligase subunit beta [Campylobacterales bacterium]